MGPDDPELGFLMLSSCGAIPRREAPGPELGVSPCSVATQLWVPVPQPPGHMAIGYSSVSDHGGPPALKETPGSEQVLQKCWREALVGS